jgi:hypothetical protein
MTKCGTRKFVAQIKEPKPHLPPFKLLRKEKVFLTTTVRIVNWPTSKCNFIIIYL